MLELAALHMCGWSEMDLPGMNLWFFESTLAQSWMFWSWP